MHYSKKDKKIQISTSVSERGNSDFMTVRSGFNVFLLREYEYIQNIPDKKDKKMLHIYELIANTAALFLEGL